MKDDEIEGHRRTRLGEESALAVVLGMVMNV